MTGAILILAAFMGFVTFLDRRAVGSLSKRSERDDRNPRGEACCSDKEPREAVHLPSGQSCQCREEMQHRQAERYHWRVQNTVAPVALCMSFVAVLAGIASAIFANGALIASQTAAKAARDQADAARETEARQLRAYVYPVTTKSLQGLSADVEIKLSVNFINGGETPAYRAAYRLHRDVLTFPVERPVETYHAQANLLETLRSNYLFKDRTISLEAPPLILTREQAQAIKEDKAMVVFWGEFVYTDVFKCRHHANFCEYYGTRNGNTVASFNCPTHNDTDDPSKCEAD